MDVNNVKIEKTLKREEILEECQDLENHSLEIKEFVQLKYQKNECDSNESSTDVIKDLSDEISIYACLYCDFKTKYKGGLKSHQDSKHFGRVFLCQFCGKKYGDHSNLNRHIRISHWHKQINKRLKPATVHNCLFCDFNSTRKENLQLHMNSLHTLENIFPCEICSYVGTRIDSYKKHVQSMHKERKKSYECCRCKFRTERRDLYNSHSKNAHIQGKQTFPCKFCHYRATFIGNLRRHVQRKHF